MRPSTANRKAASRLAWPLPPRGVVALPPGKAALMWLRFENLKALTSLMGPKTTASLIPSRLFARAQPFRPSISTSNPSNTLNALRSHHASRIRPFTFHSINAKDQSLGSVCLSQRMDVGKNDQQVSQVNGKPFVLADLMRPPAELLAMPSSLLRIDGASQRPLARNGARSVIATRRAPPAGKTQCRVKTAELECTKPQLDSCTDRVDRAGRCRYRDLDGSLVAVPLSTESLCSELRDDNHELVVVEMRAPAGDVCWLEDESVTHVRIKCGNVEHTLCRESMRAFVFKNIPLTKPTRNLARSMYTLCAPLEDMRSELLVTLVPASDLVAFCKHASLSQDT